MAESINPGDDGSATSTAAAATINHTGGVITTESLTTAAGATYSMVLTNNVIAANSIVLASVYTSGAGDPIITSITPAAGSATIRVKNDHASAALNATLVISFVVL